MYRANYTFEYGALHLRVLVLSSALQRLFQCVVRADQLGAKNMQEVLRRQLLRVFGQSNVNSVHQFGFSEWLC
jgi:hypothetical protein